MILGLNLVDIAKLWGRPQTESEGSRSKSGKVWPGLRQLRLTLAKLGPESTKIARLRPNPGRDWPIVTESRPGCSYGFAQNPWIQPRGGLVNREAWRRAGSSVNAERKARR